MVLMVYLSGMKHVEHLVMFVGYTFCFVFFSVGLLENEAHRTDNKYNLMINTMENESKRLDRDSEVFCMEGSL